MAKKSAQDPGWLLDSVICFVVIKYLHPYLVNVAAGDGMEWTEWGVYESTHMVLNSSTDIEALQLKKIHNWFRKRS